MRYVITGHEGLIGEALKKRLDEQGHECVLAIDKRSGSNILDLLTHEKVEADIFFHLAASCRINESIAHPELPHVNNVNGIFSVLEFCRRSKIPKILAASTSRVLSKEKNPYTASKIYVEELVKAYSECYGLDYIIIRPSTVYGPGFDKTSRLMSNFVVNAIKDRDLEIYGDETKTLDFTYVDDFIDALFLSMKSWNETYDISGCEEVKLSDVAKAVISISQSKSKIVFLGKEIAQPQNVMIDNAKIRHLGYSPKINTSQGISKMISWYKEHPNAIEEYEDKGKKYYSSSSKKEASQQL
jgi:nucleoside-diphosphate-sugar epimerase